MAGNRAAAGPVLRGAFVKRLQPDAGFKPYIILYGGYGNHMGVAHSSCYKLLVVVNFYLLNSKVFEPG